MGHATPDPSRSAAPESRHPAAARRSLRRALLHPVAQNAIALYGVQLVLALLPLVTLPWLARVLGPAELGLVVFVQSFSFVLGVLVEYGFNLSATRAIARQRDDPEAMAWTAAGVLGAKLSLIGAATLAALAALLLVPSFRHDPRLVAFGWGMAVLNGLSPVWFFTGIERLRLVATVDVAIRALTAAAIVLAVRHHGEGLRVLWIWTFGAGTSLAVLTALMYRRIPYRPPTGRLRALALREGRALFVAGAAVSLYTSATVFMLGLVVSSAQLALFAAAERLVRAAIRATGPISGAAFPRVNHLLEAGRPARAQQLSLLVLAAVTALGSAAALALLWLAPWLVHVLLGDGFAGSVGILRILALLLPVGAVAAAVAGLWLISRGLERYSTTVAVAAGALGLLTTPLVALLAGPAGVAWALVAIETCAALALVWIARRHGVMPARGEALGR